MEEEFLEGGGEGWEEELFQSIPEDLAVLDSSLSSSLSSLCAGKDGECPRGSEVGHHHSNPQLCLVACYSLSCLAFHAMNRVASGMNSLPQCSVSQFDHTADV